MRKIKTLIFQLFCPLNSCYKKVKYFLIVFLLIASIDFSYALNVNAIYYASCKREIGLIIYADSEKISVLSLDGRIKDISRFDIIYLAYYPLGKLPLNKIYNADYKSAVQVKTLDDGHIVDLVKGWPIDYSEETISFLTFKGEETVITRESIWELNFFTSRREINLITKSKKVNFIHPYPFRKCLNELRNTTLNLYPQQLLGDPKFIKKELDRLMIGYDKIIDYSSDQKFYPIPQVYMNRTRLGLWANIGSRYGKSLSRTNNVIPMISSEHSDGPFGFQRKIVTGSSPLETTIHEEPQIQFLYSLKADYIHFSFFYDIDRFILGEEKYKWDKRDLNNSEGRLNEIEHIMAGFDYGAFSLGFKLSTIQYGVRHEEIFKRERFSLNSLDISFQNRFFHMQLFLGLGKDAKEVLDPSGKGDDEPEEIKEAKEKIAEQEALKPDFTGNFRYLRYNLKMSRFILSPLLSLIYHEFKFYRENDQAGLGEISYRGSSMTFATYFNYTLNEDLSLAAYLSTEYKKNESGISTYETKNSKFYPKAGINVFLSF